MSLTRRWRKHGTQSVAVASSLLLLAPAVTSAAAADEMNQDFPDYPNSGQVQPDDSADTEDSDYTPADYPEYPENEDDAEQDLYDDYADGDLNILTGGPLAIAGEMLNDEELLLETDLLDAGYLPQPVKGVPADSTAYLSWDSNGALLYSIAGWETSNPKNKLPVKNVGINKATIDGLENGVDYTFVVVAAGMQGAVSYDPVQVTPLGIVPAPTSPPRLISSDESSITVGLRPIRSTQATGGITGYKVKATDTETGNEYTAFTTETRRPVVKVEGLQPGTEYELVYAGMNTFNGQQVAGEYSEASLVVVTNDTTAVQNVEVTSTGNRQATLTWDAMEGATKYVVYYSDYNDPFAEELTVEVAGAPATITGLENGVTYEFDVAAEIQDGEQLIVGDRSDPVFGTPEGVAPPSDFRIEAPGNKSMHFDWNAVSGAEGYSIKTELFDARGVDNPNVPDPVFIAAHEGEFAEKVTGLTNGAEYRFRIATVTDGEPGAYTTDDDSPLGIPMGVPGVTNPTVEEITKSSIKVSYPAPPVTEDESRATRYEVTFTPATGEPVVVESGVTTATAKGLSEGVTFTITVRAGNDAGYGPVSPDPVSATTADKPGVPQNAEVERSSDGTTATVSWEAPAPDPSTSAPSAYKVDAKPVTEGDPDPGVQTVTDTSADFAGLSATGDYEFIITGVTEAGEGPAAVVGSIGTLPAPSPAVYEMSGSSVSFSFADPGGELTPQARAWQQAAPGDKALMAAIRDGKADQLIGNQLSVIEPSSLTCDGGTCTVMFDNFADNINGDPWVFQARFTSGDIAASNWVNADVTPVVDAAVGTQEDSDDTKAPCLPDAVELPDGKCREYMDYTYSTDVQTQPYTYHNETRWDVRYNPNGDLRTDVDPNTWTCPPGWDAGGGMWGVGICKKPVSVEVKDSPPAGWYDNGSEYAKNMPVKDPTPEGWTDDGTRWTREVEQFSSECPAGTVLQPDDSCREFQDYTYSTKTETKPYTYHDEKYVDTKINPNGDCRTDVNPHTWTCPAGYTAGGGQWGDCVCKGEKTSRVKDAPPAGWYDDGTQYARSYEVKDPTPEGWTDDGTQWYRDVSSAILRDFFIKSTFAWDQDSLAANGVTTMLVNGNAVTDGKSPLLGRCPGTVDVQLRGLGGSSDTTYELCN